MMGVQWTLSNIMNLPICYPLITQIKMATPYLQEDLMSTLTLYMFSRRTYLSVLCSCLAPCALLLLPASGLWGSLGWDPDTQTCTILAPGEIDIRCDGYQIIHAA